MKNTTYTWMAFAALALITLAIPISMIREQQSILEKGTTYKFKTAPIDPVDVMRGRYVALSFDIERFPIEQHEIWNDVKEAFTIIDIDSSGFAKIDRLERKAPDGEDYIPVRINYIYPANDKAQVAMLTLPFDRYYMEEYKAPKAEQLYRDYNRPEQHDRPAYALVKIYRGKAALEDVYLDQKPIQQLLEELMRQDSLP